MSTDVVPVEAPAQTALQAKEGRTPIAIGQRGVMLQSFAELQRFAEMVLLSGAAPKGVDTIGKVAVAIQMGMERGLSPLAGVRAVFFVNGLASWRGEAAVALVRTSPACRSFKAWVEGDGDARKGVCVTHRTDEAEPHRTEFSVMDAKKAKLWQKDGPWQQYPDRQLKWRAVGFELRDQFSEVLGGFPLEDEARDIADIQAAPARQLGPVEPRALAPPAAPDPLIAMVIDAEVVEPQPRADPPHAFKLGGLGADSCAEMLMPASPDAVARFCRRSAADPLHAVGTAAADPTVYPIGDERAQPPDDLPAAPDEPTCDHADLAGLTPGRSVVCPDCEADVRRT